MEKQKITAVIFDMGQVLIHWTPFAVTEHLGLPKEDMDLLLKEMFNTVEWISLDHGTLTREQAVERVKKRIPERLWPAVEETVFGWWKQPLKPIAGMADLVRELRQKGYGLYVLSNAGTDLRDYFFRIPGAECFDGILVSAEEKLIKPIPAIYQRLAEKFNLDLGKCVFIDDSPANIEVAIQIGLPGIQFKGDVRRLRKELREMGVEVAEAT
mgnify:FL=1